MATRMLMMATTVIISMSVKPLVLLCAPARIRRAGLGGLPPAARAMPPRPPKAGWIPLPVTVFRAVQALGLAQGIDVPHVLAAPARLVGIVLVAALAPLRLAGHGVDGDA